MRTSMLPFVDIVRSDGLLADKAVDATFTSIADVFDFYGRDLATDSGHDLMICKIGSALNPPESGHPKFEGERRKCARNGPPYHKIGRQPSAMSRHWRPGLTPKL
jgi:hypothetical protein